MDTIELKLDEGNELEFQVVVEGASGISRVRLVIEDKGLALSFDGSSNSSGNVAISLPSLKKHLSEGVYPAKLEVVAEDRYFEPLSFKVDMKETVKVTSASVVTVNESRVTTKPTGTNVTVGPIKPVATAKIVTKPTVEEKTLVESRPAKQERRANPRKARPTRVDENELKKLIDRYLGGS